MTLIAAVQQPCLVVRNATTVLTLGYATGRGDCSRKCASQASITGPSTDNVCINSASRSLMYTVAGGSDSSASLTLSVTATQGVNCTVPPAIGESSHAYLEDMNGCISPEFRASGWG